MKYMIMLYGSQQDYDVLMGRPSPKPAMAPEAISAMHAHMVDAHKQLADSGELFSAHGLTPPVHARRVQFQGGVPVVTDGPYPETQEVLAGFTIVDCESYDRATEIAAKFFVNPNDEDSYVDIRPVVDSAADLEL